MRVFIYSKMFWSIKNYTTVISFFSSLVGCPMLLFTKKKNKTMNFIGVHYDDDDIIRYRLFFEKKKKNYDY